VARQRLLRVAGLFSLLQEKGFPMILSTIGLGIGAYALGAGAISSAAMIARGGVRAVGRVCHGDVRGATMELLGGVAAPAVGAVNQLAALGCEVVAVAMSITVGSSDPGNASVPAVAGSNGEPANRVGQRMACAGAASS
jgi:hypothetical protein